MVFKNKIYGQRDWKTKMIEDPHIIKTFVKFFGTNIYPPVFLIQTYKIDFKTKLRLNLLYFLFKERMYSNTKFRHAYSKVMTWCKNLNNKRKKKKSDCMALWSKVQ